MGNSVILSRKKRYSWKTNDRKQRESTPINGQTTATSPAQIGSPRAIGNGEEDEAGRTHESDSVTRNSGSQGSLAPTTTSKDSEAFSLIKLDNGNVLYMREVNR